MTLAKNEDLLSEKLQEISPVRPEDKPDLLTRLQPEPSKPVTTVLPPAPNAPVFVQAPVQERDFAPTSTWGLAQSAATPQEQTFEYQGNAPAESRERVASFSRDTASSAEEASRTELGAVSLASRTQTTALAPSLTAAPPRELSDSALPVRPGWSEAAAKLPVLASFTVERAGTELKIIDSDGSVYSGRLLVQANQGNSAAGQRSRKLAPLSTQSPTLQSRGASTQLARDSYYAAPAIMTPFQVTGTNITLKQVVVFTGSILGETNQERFVTLSEPVAAVEFKRVGQEQKAEARCCGRSLAAAGGFRARSSWRDEPILDPRSQGDAVTSAVVLPLGLVLENPAVVFFLF
jgi:hypothetical protein